MLGKEKRKARSGASRLRKACPATVHYEHLGQNIGRAGHSPTSPTAPSSPELHCFCNEQQSFKLQN